MPKTFINGIDVNYNLFGSGSPIFLIHGLGMDQSMWDLQIPELSRNYQLIIYDLRGHGQSQSPDVPYSIDLFADDLDLLLHYLGLKKAVLLGLSLGGRIALRFALKYPQEVRALILADAQSETPPENAERFRLLAETARSEGISQAAEIFFSAPFLQGLARRRPDRFQKEKRRFLQSSPIGFARTCQAIAEMKSMNDQLSGIRVPTLALAGEEDEAYLPYLDLYTHVIPDCRKEVIPQAGHVSNLENAEVFNQVVESFLDRMAKISER